MYRKKILARARGRGISPPAFVALRWPVLWKGRPAGTPEELARPVCRGLRPEQEKG